MFSENWKKILDTVDDFVRQADGPVWFRGHKSTGYKLDSGLFRLNLPNLDSYLELETQLYRHFKSLGHLLHGNEEGWKLLYSMQHHGIRTRLIDWSESFAVSLFFATEGWENNSACVWMLKPLELNLLSLGQRNILAPKEYKLPFDNFNGGKPQTFAVYPIKNNNRIVAQHGVFTVQGNGMVPMEREFSNELLTDGILKQIVLTMDVREDALQYLRQNGVTTFSMFPELDGLSRHLNQSLIKRAWI